MERHFKGIANYRRIEILTLIASRNGISLEDIAETVGGNMKTIAEHTRRLVHAGLINKKYTGRTVTHTLSPYGKTFHHFITTFSYS